MTSILAVLRQSFLALPLVVRRLRKSWPTTLVCLVGLGLGSGSVAAILAVVDVVFLRTLPYVRADELVTIRGGEFEQRIAFRGQAVNTAPWLRDCPAVSSTAFFVNGEVSFVHKGRAMRVSVAQVSPDFFRTMGTAPFAGRVLGAADSITTGAVSTVLSHELWTRLGAPREIVGDSVQVEGRPLVVVGIMPHGFDFPRRSELWVSSPDDWERPVVRGALWYEFMGRLRPGLDPEAATPILAGCRPASSNEDPGSEPVAATLLRRYVFGRMSDIVPWLQAAALMVLVIAAFNVVILQLAEEESGAVATAVSVALGADESVLRGHSLARFGVLATAGASMGVGCGFALLRTFQPLVPAALAGELSRLTLGPRPIAGVIVVCLIGTLAAALVSSAFAPATAKLLESLRTGGGTWHRHGNAAAARGLIALEIALATSLLVGFGLLTSSFHRLLAQDPGLVADHVSVAHLSLVGPAYDTAEQRKASLRTMLDDLETGSGVREAAATTDLPFGQVLDYASPVKLAGSPLSLDDPRLPLGHWRRVTPGYFSTMGIRIVEGRDFIEADSREKRRVTVVNKRLAEALGHPAGLLDHSVEFDDGTYQVIGIVSDVKHHGLALDASPEAYFPITTGWMPGTITLVASAPNKSEAALRSLLRDVVARNTTDVAFEIESMTSVMAATQQARAFAVSLVEFFASIAAILASIGAFAIARQAVVRRRGEFAVRIALGSSGAQVCGNVFGPALRWGSLGVAAGVALGFALHRALESAMPSINVGPGSDGVVWAVLAIYAYIVVATLAPALNASRTDPAELLRS